MSAKTQRTQSEQVSESEQPLATTEATYLQPQGNQAAAEDSDIGTANAVGESAWWDYEGAGAAAGAALGVWSWAVEQADGKVVPGSSVVHQGDVLILTCGLEPGVTEPAIDVSTTHFLEGQRTVTEGAVTIRLEAVTVGPDVVDVLARGPAEGEAYPFHLETSVQYRPDEFANRVSGASELAGAQYQDLITTAQLFGAAYTAAYEPFKATLDAAGEAQDPTYLLEAGMQFAVGAVASAVTGSISIGKVVADGLKDLIKWGLKELVKELPDFLQAGYGPFPTTPLDFEAALVARLMREKGDVLAFIASWRDAAYDNPFFVADFDPADAVRADLRCGGSDLTSLAAQFPVGTGGARTIETGFWARWIAESGYKVVYTAGPPTGEGYWYVQDNVRGVIVERLEALGLDAAGFEAENGGAAREAAEAEAERRNTSGAP